jgi:hypothetical protein
MDVEVNVGIDMAVILPHFVMSANPRGRASGLNITKRTLYKL